MSTKIPKMPEWASDVNLAKAKEIQRLAEIQLEDAVAIAISGDSRAATLAAAMSAISAALLAAAVTILGFTQHDVVAIGAMIASSAAFIIAAGLAVVSAAPVGFFLRGYHPYLLMQQPGDELQLIRWAVEDLGRKLEHNRKILARSGLLMNSSYGISAAGIVLPLIAVSVHLFRGS